MDENVPNGGDVAVFNIDGAKKESKPERKKIKFENSWDGQKPSGARGNAIDESKNDDNEKVDEHIDDRGEGSGDNDDVFRKRDFTE